MKHCSESKHLRRCRKDRPLCRWARKALRGAPCRCDAYHYPHRPGAGDCRVRGGGGMPSVLRLEAERHQWEASNPKTRCPHCRAVHRDHGRCA